MEVLNAYANLLWNSFQEDVRIYSNIWIWIPALIPAMVYTVFFGIKWSILLFPIWWTFNLIFSTPKRIFHALIPSFRLNIPGMNFSIKGKDGTTRSFKSFDEAALYRAEEINRLKEKNKI